MNYSLVIYVQHEHNNLECMKEMNSTQEMNEILDMHEVDEMK